MNRREFFTTIAAAAVSTQMPSILKAASQAGDGYHWYGFWGEKNGSWTFVHGLMKQGHRLVFKADEDNFVATKLHDYDGEVLFTGEDFDHVALPRVCEEPPAPEQLEAVVEIKRKVMWRHGSDVAWVLGQPKETEK